MNYYRILGVDESADAKTIAVAYDKLCGLFSPTIRPGDAMAAEILNKVKEAWGVLCDPDKKKTYDASLNIAREKEFPIMSKVEVVPPPSIEEDQEAQIVPSRPPRKDPGNFAEYYDLLFGRGGILKDYLKDDVKQKKQIPDITLTLEDILQPNVMRYTLGSRVLRVEVPAGVESGTLLKAQEAVLTTLPPVQVRVGVTPHSDFQREGANLITRVKVPLSTFQNGGSITCNSLDGPVTVTIPPRSQNEVRIEVPSRGLPDPARNGKRGILFVECVVVIEY